MSISIDEFIVLARKYQALGSSTQLLFDDVRKGSFKIQDGVRLRQLYDFILDLQYVQQNESELRGLLETVTTLLNESRDEEEERVIAERWVPEKGFPGATLWIQREDEKWAVASSPKEGNSLGKCVKELGIKKWFERPLPLLVDGSR